MGETFLAMHAEMIQSHETKAEFSIGTTIRLWLTSFTVTTHNQLIDVEQ